jgi:hypothetical protein
MPAASQGDPHSKDPFSAAAAAAAAARKEPPRKKKQICHFKNETKNFKYKNSRRRNMRQLFFF